MQSSARTGAASYCVRQRHRKVWDAESGNELDVAEDTVWVNCAVFSPDGSRILTASDDAARCGTPVG